MNSDVELLLALSHMYIENFHDLFRSLADLRGNLRDGFLLDVQLASETERRPDDGLLPLVAVSMPENLEPSDQLTRKISPHLNMGNRNHVLFLLPPFFQGAIDFFPRRHILDMHNFVGKRQAQPSGNTPRHLLRRGNEHNATGTQSYEKIAHLSTMIGKLKKRSTDGTDLVALRFCTLPAGNLSFTDQKAVIDDDINLAAARHELRPLTFSRSGGTDEGNHGKTREQRPDVGSGRRFPVNAFQCVSSPFAMTRQTVRSPPEGRW